MKKQRINAKTRKENKKQINQEKNLKGLSQRREDFCQPTMLFARVILV